MTDTNSGEFLFDLAYDLHRRREVELSKYPQENNDPELEEMRAEVKRLNKILDETAWKPDIHDKMTDLQRKVTEQEDKILGEEFCLQYYKEIDQLELESAADELKRKMQMR